MFGELNLVYNFVLRLNGKVCRLLFTRIVISYEKAY